jgi:outer membrane protein TolC
MKHCKHFFSYKNKQLLLVLVLGLRAISAFSQDTTVLYFDAFYEQVLRYHPISKQAMLLPKMAQAELRSARGAFDPTIQFNLNSKQTNGQNSYQYVEPQVKIPTLIGIDIKAGLDQSSGLTINPERGKYDPVSGTTKNIEYQLFYAGVSVPVLRGLLTDARRNQLRQAQLLSGLNQAEQISSINKLLLEAAKVYWEWNQNYQRLAYLQNGLELAKNRKFFIISRIKAGEAKAMDSVEAWVEYKRREALLNEMELAFLNSSLELSNFLWDENNNALQLMPQVIPSNKGSQIQFISLDSIQTLTSLAQEFHPDVQKLTYKLNQSQLDRRLALENLKPQLNVDYIPFQTYSAGSRDDVDGLFMKNYKLGVSFYSSVLLRKERGKLELTNYKIQQNELQLQQGKRVVNNTLLATYNELKTNEKLVSIQNELVQNAILLRNAEEYRFENGESSLFLINQRERTLIDAQVKLAELEAKYAKAKYQLQWASGQKYF